MSVPVAAANQLLEKLNQVITHKSEMIADVEDIILRLRREVEKIKDLMVEMSQYHSDSETLKETVREIRDLLDRAEDAVDSYLVEASVQKSRGVMSRVFHLVTDYPVTLRALEKDIASIAEKVKQINEDKLRSGIQVLQYLSITNKLDQSTPEADARNLGKDSVIGFDDPTVKVGNLLATGSDEDFEVISIAGMGGLGKTTLAKKVYDKVSGNYDISAFVYVSQECDRKELLLRLLGCFTQIDEDVKNTTKTKLEEQVKIQLKDKKYLVVLDDVWEAKVWDSWKHIFLSNKGKKSRVLITTRNARVAEHVNPGNSASLYRLEALNEEWSEKLLRMTVFPKNPCSDDQKEHVKRIASRCRGSPMGLVLVGGVLRNDLRPNWWKHIDGCLTRHGSDQTKVIEMAYEHLPNRLKPCFLYLGMFCENSIIHVWKLVRLWVSEGFIQEEGKATVEDTAMNYVEELVQLSLVMAEQRNSNGKVKYCRVHTALRDFCKSKAIEENLFREVKLEDTKSHESRRLCISGRANIMAYIGTQPSGMLVRSFLAFGEKEDVDLKTSSIIPKTFRLLRVLEAQSLIFSGFPTDLPNLVLLKYLAISCNTPSLPAAFSGLWNLQTLRVSSTLAAIEIQADLWNMPQFRHFHSNVPATTLNPGPKSLKIKNASLSKSSSTRSSSKKQKSKKESASNISNNIQTLCTVAPESCAMEVFSQTPALKKLGIRGDLSKLFEVGSSTTDDQLCNLTSLKTLKLQGNQMVPGLLNNLPSHLTKLTLMKTYLEWKDMGVLRLLESLAVLKLKEYAFQGPEWVTVNGCFKSLEYLAIGHTDLEVWKVSADHFPELKNLKLNGINQAIPLSLEEIFSSIESVVIYCVAPSEELKTLCKPCSNFQLIQRNRWKVSGVSS